MKIIENERQYSNKDILNIFEALYNKILIKNDGMNRIYVSSDDILSIDIDIPRAFLNQDITVPDTSDDFDDSDDQIIYAPDFGKSLLLMIANLPPIIGDESDSEYYDNEIKGLKTLLAVVSFLVQSGADINQKDSNGNTPIMALFLSNDFDASRLVALSEILKLNPDLTIQNAKGQSLLDLCFLHFQRDTFLDAPFNGKLYQLQYQVISQLLSAGLKFSAEDKRKFSGNFVFQQHMMSQEMMQQQQMIDELRAQLSNLSKENKLLTEKLHTVMAGDALTTSDKTDGQESPRATGFFK